MKSVRTGVLGAVVVVALALGLSSPVAAAPSCASLQEQEAMAVRAFQSQLMVAAVACNQADAYNRFANKYQSIVSAQGNNLKAHFQRAYGGSGEKKLNDFITELANAWSQVHLADMASYCRATWETMWKLEKHPIDTKQFVELSRNKSFVADIVPVLCAGAAQPGQPQSQMQVARK